MVAPHSVRASVNSGLATPPCTPTKMAVPTAPNVTGVLWIIMPIITAPAAGKPMATMRGAATAAGVPKPAAPSMKEPKSQAMITTWTLRSSLIPWKLRRMAATPPERSRVFKSRIAPKMIKRRSKVRNNPWTVEAATSAAGMLHTPRAMTTAVTYTSGMAHLAGMRKPTRRTPPRRIGRAARVASVAGLTCSPWRMWAHVGGGAPRTDRHRVAIAAA